MLIVPEHEAGNRQCPVPDNNDNVNPDKICIILWNSRGSSLDKLALMNKLTSVEIVGDKDAILLNQENFILKANT